MTSQDLNKKEKKVSKSIKDSSQNKFVTTTDLKNLYGMTPEQYIEGAAIHSKYFDQIKEVEMKLFE